MSKQSRSVSELKSFSNPFSTEKFPVFHVTCADSNYFFVKPGTPLSITPNYGIRLDCLDIVPKSSTQTAFLFDTKETSSGDIVLTNAFKKLNIILHKSNLFRKAAARIFIVDRVRGWAERDTLFRGYVESFTLSDNIRIKLYS